MWLKLWKNKKENNYEDNMNFKDEIEETDYKDYIDFSICNNYIDSKCQVMSEKNAFFFTGIIKEYIDKNEELKIYATRGENVPTGVFYNTPIKINIKNNSNILIIYGILERQTNEFWIIHINNIVKIKEHRECSRQPLTCKGTIILSENDTETSLECDLLDISLTGISFRSNASFEINDKVIIDNVVLYENCKTTYKFTCIIKRKFKDSNDNNCYGCMFDEMPMKIEDKLCTDIFHLQLLSNRGLNK